MKTAIDYIIGELLDNQTHQHDDYVTIDLSKDHLDYLINRAKEMEKKQSHLYAEFAIRCDRKDMKILNFEDWIKLETFKSE